MAPQGHPVINHGFRAIRAVRRSALGNVGTPRAQSVSACSAYAVPYPFWLARPRTLGNVRVARVGVGSLRMRRPIAFATPLEEPELQSLGAHFGHIATQEVGNLVNGSATTKALPQIIHVHREPRPPGVHVHRHGSSRLASRFERDKERQVPSEFIGAVLGTSVPTPEPVGWPQRSAGASSSWRSNRARSGLQLVKQPQRD
jgi:hypothetical protein